MEVTIHFNDFSLQLNRSLSSWYAGFNCSNEQLGDIASRISIYKAVRAAEEAVDSIIKPNDPRVARPSINFDVQYQCDYWNNRVLRNCSLSTPQLDEVQERILENQFAYTRDCTGASSLCPRQE